MKRDARAERKQHGGSFTTEIDRRYAAADKAFKAALAARPGDVNAANRAARKAFRGAK